MSNAQEKRVNRIAEHKGFRLEKAGHGKGHGRFYIMNVADASTCRDTIHSVVTFLIGVLDFTRSSGNFMSYSITGTDSAGALSLKRDSAAAAIQKAVELIEDGCRDRCNTDPEGVR